MSQNFKGSVVVSNNLTLPAQTASKALALDGSGNIVSSTTSGTELGYVSGVTSAIQTQINSKVNTSSVGAANGVASLDGSGKVPVAQLPSVVMEYQGSWDPTSNTPSLSDGTGSNGNVYWVSAARSTAVSGLTDPSMTNFQIGDLIIYSSSVGKWQLVTPAAGVQSVNGSQGAVTVNAINQLTGDVTAGPASGSASAAATIAAGAVTASKLATVTDGITLDQSGADSTLEIKSAGVGSTQLAANAVTNAKLATMAANTVKANVTGSSAVPTDVSIVSTATASAAMIRDSNANVQVNNIIDNFATTATAAGTTTLTVASAAIQQFTGTTTQNVQLPNATTLSTGHQFQILNRSTGSVTVKDGSGTTILTMSPSTQLSVTCTANGSSAGTWDLAYTQYAGNAVTSVNSATGAVTVNAINQLTGDITAGPASGSQSQAATIASGAVTASKLGTVTDGITLDQSGSGSTIEVKAGGIANTQIASAAAIAVNKLAALTVSRAVASDSSGFLTASSVTSTELGYVGGVTSSIQTQINNINNYILSTDIAPTTFNGANNQSSAANVTGFSFSTSTVRGFDAICSVYINATSNLAEQFRLLGSYNGTTYSLAVESTGDNSGVTFSVTSAGQVQYTSSNVSGFVSMKMDFRALTSRV